MSPLLKSGVYFCTRFDTVVLKQVFHDFVSGCFALQCFMLALVLFRAVLL